MGNSKVCTKCNENKELNFFCKNKSIKDGFNYVCKQCVIILNKKNRENNPEYGKIYRNLNNQKEKERHLNYYKNNKEKESERKKKYRLSNTEKIKNISKKYRKENLKYYKEYQEKYRKNNPHIFSWRNLLIDSLRRFGKPKEGHTIELLGYSATDLKNHITTLFTDGMSWDNHGEWHIDHIKRVSEFDKETHPSIVNALSNLRPLWATTREINGVIYEGNLNRG